jgi:DNA-binding phage protein
MQGITGIRDKIRADVEELDGGYTTVAKILRKSTQFVHKTLSVSNNPRLDTLEEIKSAVETAKNRQQIRMERLTA